MQVNVLVECRDSHAYLSVTQEKIIKIAKDMHNGISSFTYPQGELVTRQWCGWELCTTHRERKRKKEQNRGDRKKEWKSEMNDGGNFGFSSHDVWGGGWRWAGPQGAATRSQLKDGKCMELMAQAASVNVDGKTMYQKPTGWLVELKVITTETTTTTITHSKMFSFLVGLHAVWKPQKINHL